MWCILHLSKTVTLVLAFLFSSFNWLTSLLNVFSFHCCWSFCARLLLLNYLSEGMTEILGFVFKSKNAFCSKTLTSVNFFVQLLVILIKSNCIVSFYVCRQVYEIYVCQLLRIGYLYIGYVTYFLLSYRVPRNFCTVIT